MESSARKAKKGIFDQFAGIFDNKEFHENDEDEEEVSDLEEKERYSNSEDEEDLNSGRDYPEEADNSDDMNVEDVTPLGRKRKRKDSSQQQKIVETDFESVQLARLAKSSVRMAICIDDMWPLEDQPSVELLEEELGKMGNEDLLDSLSKITCAADKSELEKLKKFMNYAPSQVRFEMAKPTRFLTAEFFQLSGAKGQKGQEEASRVQWLLKDKRYLERVDVQARKAGGSPFESPLIGKILQAHFISTNSRQDTFLKKYLKELKAIPEPLIVMISTLIEHAIFEWTSGTKADIYLTRGNTEPRYRSLWNIMTQLQQNSPLHVELQTIELYQNMISASLDEDDENLPTYDYDRLESLAREKLQRIKSGENIDNNPSNYWSSLGGTSGGVRPTSGPSGSIRPAPKPSGSIRPAPRPSGSKRPATEASGSVRSAPRPSGSVRPAPRPSGRVHPATGASET
ncbi:hypothetical protein F5878DRAFT_667767, partial [Lentinula raphanica]